MKVKGLVIPENTRTHDDKYYSAEACKRVAEKSDTLMYVKGKGVYYTGALSEVEQRKLVRGQKKSASLRDEEMWKIETLELFEYRNDYARFLIFKTEKVPQKATISITAKNATRFLIYDDGKHNLKVQEKEISNIDGFMDYFNRKGYLQIYQFDPRICITTLEIKYRIDEPAESARTELQNLKDIENKLNGGIF